jgi:hypothetical protein
MHRARDENLKTVIQKNVNGTRTYIRRVVVRVIMKMDLRICRCRDCDFIHLYWDRSCDESPVTHPVLQTSENLLIR